MWDEITTKLNNVWKEMNRRCNNPKDCNYHKYGAKGIKVCKEWLRNCDGGYNGFYNFYNWAINNGYEIGLTLDRKNPFADYCPENCQWVTYEAQNRKLVISTRNSSGYIGVSKGKSGNKIKWRARISLPNNKHFMIGMYDTKKEAVDSRNNYILQNKLEYPIQKWIGEEGYKREKYKAVYE